MKASFVLSLVIVSSGVFASSLPKVLLSNIPGHPTNFIPGGGDWQSGDSDVFDTLVISADRSKWAIKGEQENGSADRDIVVAGPIGSITGLNITAREGDSSGFSAELISLIRPGIAVNNNGVTFLTADTDAATSQDDIVFSSDGTVRTLVVREGTPLPGVPGINVGSSNSSIHVLDNGAIRWLATGLGNALTGQTQALYEWNNGVGTVLARSGITTPTGQVLTPQTVQTFTVPRFQSARETGDFYYNATLNGPTTSNVIMAVNNQVYIQESVIPSWSGFGTAISSLSSNFAHTITANGAFKVARGSLLTSNNDFVVMNETRLAETDLPIATGATELWDDSSYSPTFFFSTANRYGETVIGGTTNNADTAKNAVLVFTSCGWSRVILREGDPVDLDGDGNANDNVFVSVFDDDTIVLSDGNELFLAVELVDASAVYVGDAVLRMRLPLTGDVDDSGEVDLTDIDMIIANYLTSNATYDLDGNGEVDLTDIDCAIANYLRSR